MHWVGFEPWEVTVLLIFFVHKSGFNNKKVFYPKSSVVKEIKDDMFCPIPGTYLCVNQMGPLGFFLFSTIFFQPPYTAALRFEPTSVVRRVAPD